MGLAGWRSDLGLDARGLHAFRTCKCSGLLPWLRGAYSGDTSHAGDPYEQALTEDGETHGQKYHEFCAQSSGLHSFSTCNEHLEFDSRLYLVELPAGASAAGICRQDWSYHC